MKDREFEETKLQMDADECRLNPLDEEIIGAVFEVAAFLEKFFEKVYDIVAL